MNPNQDKLEGFLFATQIIVGIITGVCALQLFGIELWMIIFKLINRKKSKQHGGDNLELQCLLFFQLASFAGMLTVIDVMIYNVPFPDTLNCDALAKLMCVFYIGAVQGGFLFMTKKASIVSGFEKGKLFRNVSYLTKWGLIVFCPLFGIPLAVAFDVGFVSAEGVCLIKNTQVWFPILFCLGSFGLSAALLYLFITPLLSIVKSSDTPTAAHDMIMKVIRRNVAIAGVMVTCTTIHFTTGCVFWILAQQNPDFTFLLIYVCFGAAVDMSIMCICCRLMTNVWLPSRFQSRRKQIAYSTSRSPKDPLLGSPARQGLAVSPLSSASEIRLSTGSPNGISLPSPAVDSSPL